MTTSQYVLNAVILVWILRANLGTQVLTPRRILLPVTIDAVAASPTCTASRPPATT